jgi:phytoene desaturase
MRIAVIGSGIGGLSSAIHLAKKGHSVSVFERNDTYGGKLGIIKLNKYSFDTGPSLLTMPHLIDELFQMHGENPRDYFNYRKKDIHCKYFWDDKTNFTAFSDKSKYINEAVSKFYIEKDSLLKYFSRSKKKYDLINELFLFRPINKISTYLNFDTVKALLNLKLFQLFSSLDQVNNNDIGNRYMIQVFNRYATYNGSSPYLTPGIMTIIQHLENHYGTHVCDEGMRQIPTSMYELCRKIGVKFHFNKSVESIIVKNKEATGIKLKNKILKFDKVISNVDVNITYKKLLNDKTFLSNKKNMSSSALIFFWGINREFKDLDLHNILFSNDYKEEFKNIFEKNEITNDPTIYINITSKDIKNVSPKGCENWFVMINSPKDIGQDWDKIKNTLRKNIIEKINKNFSVNIQDHIVEERVFTPKDISINTNSYLGSLYGESSNGILSPLRRHQNFSRSIKNLYFCGGTVHPGGGIPLCIMSSKIVSDLIEKSN